MGIQQKSTLLLRRSRCCVLKTGERWRWLCGQPSRGVGVVPCAHVSGRSKHFTRAAVRQPFTRHWLSSAARTRECACLSMTETGNARRIRDGQNKGGRAATHTKKGESTDVWRQTRRSHSSSSSPPQRSPEGPPGLAMVAATSIYLVSVRERGGW